MSSSDTNTGGVIAATAIGMLLPTLAVGVRIIARRYKGLTLYADDCLIVTALIFKFAIDIAGCILIEHGLGRHITTVTPRDLVIFLQVQYTGAFLYPLCTTFTKLSILFQYKRLFAGKFFRYAVDIIMTIIILWCVAVCFTGIFICTPIDKAWMPTKPGHCINMVSFYYGLQIPNVITDAAILILPLKEVASLKLPKQQKIGVALTCALWLLCLIFGIVRLVVMLGLSSKGNDLTWILVDGAIWTTVEPTVGIITACLPSMRIIYHNVAKAFAPPTQDSQRLESLSGASAMRNGQTLMECPRTPRTLNYGASAEEEKDYDETLHKYPSTVPGSVSITSPATKYASSEEV